MEKCSALFEKTWACRPKEAAVQEYCKNHTNAQALYCSKTKRYSPSKISHFQHFTPLLLDIFLNEPKLNTP